MLQNLLFSVNMILPLFVLLGLGCFLTHKGLFSEPTPQNFDEFGQYLFETNQKKEWIK